MKLLPRLYEPENGRILLDGYDIASWSWVQSVAKSVLFPRTTSSSMVLFARTLFYCPDATPRKSPLLPKWLALDFIMDFTPGLRHTSWGTWQCSFRQSTAANRYARAVLQKRLLILDEATSALDYMPSVVSLNLKKAFEGSTVFFITHRLSTIRSADQILMMDKGSLVETGSHKDLIDQQGRYFALYSQQEVGLD